MNFVFLCVHVYTVGVCVCVSVLLTNPDTESCNWMATFALALTGAIFFCSLVLFNQRLYTLFKEVN